jgi:hypothetical protein
VDDFRDATIPREKATGDDDDEYHAALQDFRDMTQLPWPWSPPRLVDQTTGRACIRRADFADFVRRGRRLTISWP